MERISSQFLAGVSLQEIDLEGVRVMTLSYFALFIDQFRFLGPSGIHGMPQTTDLSEVNGPASSRTEASSAMEVSDPIPEEGYLHSRLYLRR